MQIINAALGKAGAQNLLMPILVRRPSSNVQADMLKGDGAPLSALSNRRTPGIPLERLRWHETRGCVIAVCDG